MEPSDSSFSEALSSGSNLGADRTFSLYFSLVRVGLSILSASFAVGAIVVLLYAPTLLKSQLSLAERVGLSILTSAAAFKLVKFFRFSNTTVLKAGSERAGGNPIWGKITESKIRMGASILVFIILSALIVLLGLAVIDIVPAETSEFQEGSLSDLGPLGKLILNMSSVAFVVGVIFSSVGFALLIWTVLIPVRSSVLRGYYYIRYRLIIVSRSFINTISDVHVVEPSEHICSNCFYDKFRVQSNEVFSPEDISGDYSLVCGRCNEELGTVDSINEDG
jgi:hypothetical protein